MGMAGPSSSLGLMLTVWTESINHSFLLLGDGSLRLLPYRDPLPRLANLPPPSPVYIKPTPPYSAVYNKQGC